MALTDGLKNKLGAIADAIREKNGTEQQYMPSEMAEAIRGIYDGYDFTTIGYTKDESDEINALNTNGISVAKEIIDGWNIDRTNYNLAFSDRDDIVYFPIVDCNNAVTAGQMFANCTNLRKIKLNMPNVTSCVNLCFRSGIEDVELTIPNGVNVSGLAYYGNLKKLNLTLIKINEYDKLTISLNTIAYGCGRFTGEDFIINNNSEDVLVTNLYYAFRECFNLIGIDFIMDISQLYSSNNQPLINAFTNTDKLKYVWLKNWKNYDLNFVQSGKLSSESIHYIIQNAMSKDEGATDRILSLNSQAKTNWQNSEYYQADLAVLLDKGITIA